ncbi:hypothetical protein [Saccharopolyspora griseoalba]|uniref:Uncharacterized protein n=1 Tax=Saccharopolyspora griseoalba TaxID=1431848 RepID=A0ABW2LUI2_9PSEU
MPRIEFDNDGSRLSQLLNLAEAYRSAMDEGDVARAAGYMHRIENTAARLTDEALLTASKSLPRREIASRAGWVAHGTVNHRINRARREAGLDQDSTPQN